ncbi:MAG TPA: hypothetical protein VIT92_13080 [Burkholderiaceae bacterium]
MPSTAYTRDGGQRLTYSIRYDRGEYFIERDGVMKKSVPDALINGIPSGEDAPELMLKMAKADIDALIGMEE